MDDPSSGPAPGWLVLALLAMGAFALYQFGGHLPLPCAGKLAPLKTDGRAPATRP